MYVDIGAASPSHLSVTKLFYDRGWSGINVEPSAYWWSALQQSRPRDVNLALAISDHRGEIVLHDGSGDDALYATVDPRVAEHVTEPSRDLVPRVVPCITLAELFDEYVHGRVVDFLKVDVEGHELEVIAGNDWARHRPRVLVVEAVWPTTTTPSYESWNPIVLEAGYLLAAIDPVNRFYVRSEDSELADLLADDRRAKRARVL